VSLYVGTSGWAYKEWKPDFYPQSLPHSRFLEHYGASLSACEVNATFYRLQSDDTFAKWSRSVPGSFRFTTKVHRRLTHARRIAPEGEQRDFLNAFLRSVSQLGDKLGALLIQFPPYRHRDDESLLSFLQALPESLPFACEFRHDSWDHEDVRQAIAGAGGTVCLSETEGKVPEQLPSGPLAYVRLRSERYSPEARTGWRDLLASESTHRDVYAFAKHEGIPTSDPYGGVGLAVWLTSSFCNERPLASSEPQRT
jgi:uncharacterized protein YecE (DUF72 family)